MESYKIKNRKGDLRTMAKKKEEIVAEATQEQVDLEKVAEENAKVLV